MRHLRLWLNLGILFVPLIVLAIGGFLLIRQTFTYLNSNVRLASVASAEASRLLGREVRVGDVRITGNLWSLASPNRVELYNVQIADLPARNGKPFVKIAKATLLYNLQQIIGTEDLHIPYVNDILIEEPEVALVRDRGGIWNFAELIKPTTQVSRPVTDKITVVRGTLDYQDEAFPAPQGIRPAPFDTRIQNINGTVLLRPDRSAAFTLTTGNVRNVAVGLQITGSFAPETMQVQGRLQIQKVALSQVAERLLSPTFGKISSGIADLDVSGVYSPTNLSPEKRFQPDALYLSGNVKAESVSGTSPQISEPVNNLSLTASFDNETLTGQTATTFGGSPLQLTGSIYSLALPQRIWPKSYSTLLPEAILFAQLSAQKIDIKRVLRLREVQKATEGLSKEVRDYIQRTEGRADISMRAEGNITKPTAALTASLDTLRVAEYSGSKIVLHALYAQDVVSANLRGQVAKGKVTARARIALDKTGKFQIEGRGRNLHLASLDTKGKLGLSGMAQADMRVEGVKGRTPHIQARAQMADLGYKGQSLKSVYLDAENRGRELLLKRARVEDAKGYVVASGTANLDKRTLNIGIEADEVDLGAILQALQQGKQKDGMKSVVQEPVALEGVGYLRGQDENSARLTGTFDQPVLHGRLSAFNVRAGRVECEQVETRFDLTPDRLSISRATAYLLPGSVSITGIVGGLREAEPTLSLTARAEGLDLNYLLRIANLDTGAVDVTGLLSTDTISLVGTLSNIQTRQPFQVTLEDARLNDLPVEDATAVIAYSPEGLRILQADLNVANGVIKTEREGIVRTDGTLDLVFRAEDLRLGRLALALDTSAYGARGLLDARVVVRGSTDKPQISLTVHSDNLAINTYTFGNLFGTLRIQDRHLFIENLDIIGATQESTQRSEVQPGRIQIAKMDYNLDTKNIKGEAQWDSLSFASFRSLLVNIAEAGADVFMEPEGWRKGLRSVAEALSPLEGSSSGKVALTGTASDPLVSLNWYSMPLSVKGYSVTLQPGSGTITSKSALFPQIVLQTKDGNIEGNIRKMDFQGDIDAGISAREISLGFLQTWLTAKNAPTITGTGTIEVAFSGKTLSPDVQASVNLRDVVYRDRFPGQKDPTELAFQRVDIDDITISNGRIESKSLGITQRDTVVRGKASLDGFTWSAPFIPDTAPLSFEATLQPRDADTQNLSLITWLFPDLLTTDSTGRIYLTTDIHGTRANPLASVVGTFHLVAPHLQLAQFSTGLRDVDGTLKLDGEELIVENFKGQTRVFPKPTLLPARSGPVLASLPGPKTPVPPVKEADRPVRLYGRIPLGFSRSAPILPSDGIHLEADAVPFAEDPLPGTRVARDPGSGRAIGEAQIRLLLANTLKEPLIAGNIDISNAQLTLPRQFGGLSEGKTEYSIDPRLQLKLNLGKNVRLSGPLLTARTEGSLLMTGTLSAPRLDGRFQLPEGRLTLPTARLTFLPQSRLDVRYPVLRQGEQTLSLDLDVQVKTTLSKVSIFGTTQRSEAILRIVGPLSGSDVDPLTGQSSLRITSLSDPNASSQSLVEGLVLGNTNAVSMLTTNPSQALVEQLTNVFTGSLLPSIFDRSIQQLGLSDLSFGVDASRNFNFTVTRNFGPFYVSYTRNLASSARDVYLLRGGIRFRGPYQISYEINELNEQRVLLEGIWRF